MRFHFVIQFIFSLLFFRPIRKNEEMNISYFRTESMEFTKRQEYMQHYYFFCNCSMCSVDARQLTTIICPKCKSGPIIFTRFRVGCQNCQQVLKNGNELLEELEKHLEVIEKHRRLINRTVTGFTTQDRLDEIYLAKKYLLDNMYRKSEAFERCIKELLEICLQYSDC